MISVPPPAELQCPMAADSSEAPHTMRTNKAMPLRVEFWQAQLASRVENTGGRQTVQKPVQGIGRACRFRVFREPTDIASAEDRINELPETSFTSHSVSPI